MSFLKLRPSTSQKNNKTASIKLQKRPNRGYWRVSGFHGCWDPFSFSLDIIRECAMEGFYKSCRSTCG